MSTSLRRNRLITLVAAIALIACASFYSAHSLGDRVHTKTHCDLCEHFGGTAGSPTQAAPAGKPVLVVRVRKSGTGILLPVRRKAGPHLPRAPPLRQEPISASV